MAERDRAGNRLGLRRGPLTAVSPRRTLYVDTHPLQRVRRRGTGAISGKGCGVERAGTEGLNRGDLCGNGVGPTS
jgi:hypothetical protein